MPKDRERTGVQDQKVEGKDGWHCSHQEKQGRQVELFSDSKELMRGQTAFNSFQVMGGRQTS